MIVVVGALQLGAFVPDQRLQAQTGAPVELDETGLSVGIDQLERVDAKALDHAQAARNGAVRHRPDHRMQAFRHQRHEIPERVMRRGGLRIAAIRLHLDRVDQVGKLDGILNKEHRDIVADEIPIALIGIELDRKAPHVARRVDRARTACHRRETREHRGPLALLGKKAGLRQFGYRVGAFEIAMRGRTTGMHDTLGDAFMVEVKDLFAQQEIFQKRRPACSGAQTVLIVGNRDAMIGGHGLAARLLRLSAVAFAGGVAVGRCLLCHVVLPFLPVGTSAFWGDNRRHAVRFRSNRESVGCGRRKPASGLTHSCDARAGPGG